MKKGLISIAFAILVFVVVGMIVASTQEKTPEKEGFNQIDSNPTSGDEVSEESLGIKNKKEEINKLFGETWHSDNYKKEEVEIPAVEAEEIVDGELWFPVINNTAPLEEIAPTISYELMLDGYIINPYYPDNPEDYTAAALNENAFPIGFFRKVSDLCYYTVCKVEGGGYIYYFFSANSNVTREEYLEYKGEEVEYLDNGVLSLEDEYGHLFNTELADIDNMDLTKEVIWRGSVYVTPDLGTKDNFITKTSSINTNDWYNSTPYGFAQNISQAFKPLADLQDSWAENMSDNSMFELKDKYALLSDVIGRELIRIPVMCSDGYIYPTFYALNGFADNTEEVNGIIEAESLKFEGNALFYNIYSYRLGGLKEQVAEYNSFSIEVLPHDNINAK